MNLEELKELRKHRKKVFKLRFNTIDQIIATKPVNRKKNRGERRQRPPHKAILARSEDVYPRGISESKYNPDGSLKENKR